MKGFVVYPTYRVIEDPNNGKKRALVHLYGRLENGESFLLVAERKAYFYIKKIDRDKAGKILPLKFNDEGFVNFDGENVVKVIIDNPKDVTDARKILQEDGITCYEADIHFPYRFLIDNNIKACLEMDGKSFSGKEYNSLHGTNFSVDKVFVDPTIKPADYWPELKVLSFDIETDMKAEKLYSISIVCGKYKNVLINKKGVFNNADSFDDTQSLLKAFARIVKELDPDIITGWNVVDFDLNVLKGMFRKYDMDFAIGRDNTNIFIKQSDNFFQDSIAKIEGRAVLDGISQLKTSFIRLPDYKLETAASHFTDKGKIFKGDERFKEIEKAYENDPQTLINYNLLDSELVIDILEKSNALNLTITRSKLTRMQLDRVKASIASLDSLYLEKLRERKIVAPTSYAGDRDERITGGYVRSSIPGIYNNILVFDFKSLYPSIIRTFNIDPWGFVTKNKLVNFSKEESDKFIVAPNGANFKPEEGIMPEIIETLWAQRDKAKKEKDDLRSYAIKILMNSFFGVLANPTCRFYSIEMGNAITLFGQYLIKKTADEVEKKGYKVIYGDTDSIFIDIHEKDYNNAKKIGDDLCNWINDFFTSYIEKEYNRQSKMEIEFEKVYKRFFMPRVRGSDVGAKKRYAGILEKEGKDKIDFVGLEFVRSDWTSIAKEFQLELLNKVFNEEQVVDYVRKFIKDLRAGKYDDKLIYRKQIRKSVSSYTKTTPPHIQAARKIGRDDTGLIDYVMTKDGPEEIDHMKSKPDYEHYIEKQIKPIADSVLGFFDAEFDDLIKDHKQNTLLDFG
ncbi:DNA polymerase II [Candidatus Woesearchaeota archaeon]|nr:DNA polymerase II [Candidatus Woesearchaeota archaeon]